VKFSISQMLYGMVVFAFIAAIIGAGANGSPLAYGIGVSILLAIIYFVFFGILYWGTLLITGGRRNAPPQPRPVLANENGEEAE